MNVKYISQEQLEVIRKFLESKDLKELPYDIPKIMWRAKDLYTTDDEDSEVFLTKSKKDKEDIIVLFDENGTIMRLIIAKDSTDEFWTFN